MFKHLIRPYCPQPDDHSWPSKTFFDFLWLIVYTSSSPGLMSGPTWYVCTLHNKLHVYIWFATLMQPSQTHLTSSFSPFFSSHRILDSIPANVFSCVKTITKIIIELWSGSCYMLEAWRRSVIWKGHNQSEKCPNYSKFRKGWLSGASQQTAEPLKTLQKSLLLKICTWVKLDQDSPD